MQYLIGAPLAWAGLSRTVMVVAVSLRKASDPSYSSIVGAEKSDYISDLSCFLQDTGKKLPKNVVST